MSLPQSPPTSSGIVVISGSDLFDPATSDFRVIRGTIQLEPKQNLFFGGSVFTENLGITGAISPEPRIVLRIPGNDIQAVAAVFTNSPITGFISIPLDKQDIVAPGFIPGSPDINITSTSVTSSGIVVMDFFPGAGTPVVPFVPPVVINERLFPIFQGTNFERTFPEENRRVFPVLPQFSTLTPGD